MRRNIDAAHGLTFFGGRSARAGRGAAWRARRPTRSCSGNALRAFDEELPLRQLLEADPEAAALAGCRYARPYLRPRDAALRNAERRIRPPGGSSCLSSLALDHLASGKVRELYDAGDGRLLLVASDRISAFDVVLPTPIPDKGRVLDALSLHWFALTRRHRPQPRRLGESSDFPEGARDPDSPGARCSCSGSRCCRSSASCAATSRARAGRTTSARAPCAASRCPTGLREADRLPRAALHARRRRPTSGPRREHHRRAGPRARRRRALPRGRARRARALRARGRGGAGARDHPRRHEVRVRRSTATARSCSPTRC